MESPRKVFSGGRVFVKFPRLLGELSEGSDSHMLPFLIPERSFGHAKALAYSFSLLYSVYATSASSLYISTRIGSVLFLFEN